LTPTSIGDIIKPWGDREMIHFHIPSIKNYDVSYYFSEKTEGPKKYPFHVNDKLEFYVLLEGDVSFAVDSSVYNLKAGDAVVTRPNEMHNCIVNSNSFHKHMCLWFESENEFLFSDFLKHDFGQNNHIIPDEEGRARLFEICNTLREIEPDKDNHLRFILTLELLYIFRKFIPNENKGIKELPENLKIILSDIEVNFKEIHSLLYFEQKYYMSASTLNRLFNKYLHTTPKSYIESKKLANSRKLLKSGKSVLYSSVESGFFDYSNYIRLFKKRFGVTPRQYREEEKPERSLDSFKDSRGKRR
jgi:AraC-like DNA-binding protein